MKRIRKKAVFGGSILSVLALSCAQRGFNTESPKKFESYAELNNALDLSAEAYLEALQDLIQRQVPMTDLEYFETEAQIFEPLDASAEVFAQSGIPSSNVKRMIGKAAIEAKVKATLKPLAGLKWGYEFIALGSNGERFQIASANPNQKMEPASTTKLFTGYAAQKLIGETFKVTYPKALGKSFNKKEFNAYMLQTSNNNVAEIFRTVAGGQEKLNSFYESQGVKLSADFVQTNGSGCNGQGPLNFMTARDQISLLMTIYNNQNDYKTFCDSLASPGVANSTLGGSFAGFDLRNNVCAKTGTFALAKGLSGYVKINDKWTIAFATMANGAIKTKKGHLLGANHAGAGNYQQRMIVQVAQEFQAILAAGGPKEDLSPINLLEEERTDPTLNETHALLLQETPNPFAAGGNQCPSKYYKP